MNKVIRTTNITCISKDKRGTARKRNFEIEVVSVPKKDKENAYEVSLYVPAKYRKLISYGNAEDIGEAVAFGFHMFGRHGELAKNRKWIETLSEVEFDYGKDKENRRKFVFVVKEKSFGRKQTFWGL